MFKIKYEKKELKSSMFHRVLRLCARTKMDLRKQESKTMLKKCLSK